MARKTLRRTAIVVVTATMALGSFLVGVAFAAEAHDGPTVYYCQNGGFGWLGASKWVQIGYTGVHSSTAYTKTKYTSGCDVNLPVDEGNISTYAEMRIALSAYTYAECGHQWAGNPDDTATATATLSMAYNQCYIAGYCTHYTKADHYAGIYGETRWSTWTSPGVCV